MPEYGPRYAYQELHPALYDTDIFYEVARTSSWLSQHGGTDRRCSATISSQPPGLEA